MPRLNLDRRTKTYRVTIACRPERSEEDTMNHVTKYSLRANPLNHHLWRGYKCWLIHFTIYPDRATKKRIRRSLHTRDVKEARLKRDAILAALPEYNGIVS